MTIGLTTKTDIAELYTDSMCLLTVEDTPEGMILHASTHAELLFGYTARKELIGQSIHVLVPDDRLEEHKKGRGEYLKNRRPMFLGMETPVFGKRKDGSLVQLLLSVHPGTLYPTSEVLRKEVTVCILIPFHPADYR